MRRCAGCGNPLKRWQRGCFHGIYTAVTPFAWEERAIEFLRLSTVTRIWRWLAYGDPRV